MADKQVINPRQVAAQFAQMMGLEINPDAYAVEVVRTGDKVIIPENGDLPEIINALTKQHKAEEQPVTVKTDIAVPPWDGAMALQHAIGDVLGLVIQRETFNMFGIPQPVGELEIEVDYGKTATVKWGQFELPGMDGAVANTRVDTNAAGDLVFQCVITCRRKFKERALKILDRMRTLAMTTSLHKGKAFSLQFHDDDGDRIDIPIPKFFPLTGEAPIFRTDLERAIDRYIALPLEMPDEVQGILGTLKRGVLLAGEYGTGKTLLAAYIASIAVPKWTFMYVKEASDLPLALRWAPRLAPIVIFAEDVDRVAGTERTHDVNTLLNQLDGIDVKGTGIMTILTTNFPNKINPAMRRPGRIDLILPVLPPDDETVSRMVRAFAGEALEPDADLTEIGRILNGFQPAFVREAVGRARLEALRRTRKSNSLINGDDLAIVAQEVATERELFRDKAVNPVPSARTVAHGLTAAAAYMNSMAEE